MKEFEIFPYVFCAKMDKKGTRESSSQASRPKKRQFYGNRHTLEGDTTFASTSAAKLLKSGDDSFDVHVDPLTTPACGTWLQNTFSAVKLYSKSLLLLQHVFLMEDLLLY